MYSVVEIFSLAFALTNPKMEDDDNLVYSTWCGKIHSTHPNAGAWENKAQIKDKM